MARGFGDQWFDVSGNERRTTSRKLRRQKHRPVMEALEERVVLNAAPVAKDDFVLTAAGQPVLVDYLALNDTDPDGDPLTVTSVVAAAHGTLTDNGDGTWTYVPMQGFVGADSFTYVVSDGSGATDVGLVKVSVNEDLNPQAVRNALLAGVSALRDPSQPSYTIAYGPTAVSVGKYVDSENSMISAASWGSGKVVALPDHQWLRMTDYAGDYDTGRFYLNTVKWLGGSSSLDVKIVVLDEEKVNWLSGQGYTNVVQTNWTNLAADLVDADVFIPGFLGANVAQENLDTIADFTRDGGGLFIADYGAGYLRWWDKAVDEAPGNRLLREAGIGFTKYYWGSAASFPVDRTDVHVTAEGLLDMLENPSHYTEEEALHAQDMVFHMRYVLPPDDSYLLDIVNKLDEAVLQVYATPETPVYNGVEKMLLRQEARAMLDMPPREVVAHRTAELLYGEIPEDAPRLTGAEVTIDGNKSGWVATGLYAVPGELVTLHLPNSLVGRGYEIRINGHRDDISAREGWERLPYGVTRSFPINSNTVEVANAFGGQIYIDFGGGAEGGSQGLGDVNLTIDGAIAAPLFVLGKTTDQEWIASLRDNPAPYAELVSDHVAMSVPAAWIRDLENPTALMQYWNDVVAFQDWVGGLENLRTGPERINYDAQIRFATLHSGYPTQTSISYGDTIVHLEELVENGDWGWFHEMGHEMQNSSVLGWGLDNPYTFPDDVEVTVNIFANAALEYSTTSPWRSGWSWSADPWEVMQRALNETSSSSSSHFEDKEVYAFYFQLADGPWGWQGYRDVLSTYVGDALNDVGSLPTNGQEEKDQWYIRWSEATGFDMTAFMVDYWGLEVSAGALNTVDAMNLPSWLPIAAQYSQVQVLPGGSYSFDLRDNVRSFGGSPDLVNVGAASNGSVTLSNSNYVYTPNPGAESDSFTVTYQSPAGNQQTFVIDIEISPNGVLMERFTNISGSGIPDLTNSPAYPTHPSVAEIVDKFESPSNVGSNYGLRMQAYLIPPTTGDYTFWLASDDDGELWLSSDDNPQNKLRIANVADYTRPHQWTKLPSQKSATFSLIAGQRYYIEALMKEWSGDDHLSVAWTGPGFDEPTVIDGEYLMAVPFRDQDDVVARNVDVEVPATGASFDVINDDGALNLSVVSVSQGQHGNVSINPDGTVHYLPNVGYVGRDTFGFTITNPDGKLASAIVNVQVQGLVSFWSMNERSGQIASDSGAVPSPGILDGPTWTNSPHGGALEFDGFDDSVYVGTAGSLEGRTNFTVGAWIKTTAGGVIVQQRDIRYDGEYSFLVTPEGNLQFYLYGNDAYQFDARTSLTVNDDEWHYVVAQRDGRAGRIYIDGELAASSSGTMRNLNASIGVYIGVDFIDRSKYFQGQIDEVRVYNYALSQQEISDLQTVQVAIVDATLGNASVLVSNETGGSGFLDIRLQVSPGETKPIVGYRLNVEVDSSSGIELTSVCEAPGALLPGRSAQLFGSGSSVLVMDALASVDDAGTLVDGVRLFRLEFDVPAGVTGTFNVRLIDIVLTDSEGNSIPLPDVENASITVRDSGAPIASELILRPVDQLRSVGTSGIAAAPAPSMFHEWEDVGGELWLQIDDDVPNGPFDLYVEMSFAPELFHPIEFVTLEGATLRGNATTGLPRTVQRLNFEHLDLSGFEAGTRVLIATIIFPIDYENLVGLSVDSAAYPGPVIDGFQLDKVEVETFGQSMHIVSEAPAKMAPVVYDSNDDGQVGLRDFSDFVAAFGASTAERPEFSLFDYNRDGRVGLSDFSLFVQHFGFHKPTANEIEMPGLMDETPAARVADVPLEGEPLSIWEHVDDRVMGMVESNSVSRQVSPPLDDEVPPIICRIDPEWIEVLRANSDLLVLKTDEDGNLIFPRLDSRLLEDLARDQLPGDRVLDDVKVVDNVFGKPLEDDLV